MGCVALWEKIYRNLNSTLCLIRPQQLCEIVWNQTKYWFNIHISILTLYEEHSMLYDTDVKTGWVGFPTTELCLNEVKILKLTRFGLIIIPYHFPTSWSHSGPNRNGWRWWGGSLRSCQHALFQRRIRLNNIYESRLNNPTPWRRCAEKT